MVSLFLPVLVSFCCTSKRKRDHTHRVFSLLASLMTYLTPRRRDPPRSEHKEVKEATSLMAWLTPQQEQLPYG